MVSSRKVLGLVSLSVMLSVFSTGCFFGDPDDTIDPPSLEPYTPPVKEQKLLSRSCGNEGDYMIASYTHETLAKQCGESVTINGVEVKGTRAYNEQDRRWSVGFLIPKGTTSGDVIATCGPDKVNLGRLEVPCATVPEGENTFLAYEGELKMSNGCDDNDYKVTLGQFTKTTFVMTGLAKNGPITFTVNGNTAQAENVTQYDKPGHTVKLTLDASSGKIRFEASSSQGSCATSISK